MSGVPLTEFRALFDKEILCSVQKYMSACKKDAGAEEGPQLGQLRKVANSMASNTLRRLVEESSALKLDGDALRGCSWRSEMPSTNNPGLELKVEELRAKEQELEALLSQRRQEQQRRQEKMRTRVQSHFEDSLHDLEQQLMDVRRSATFEHQDSFSSDEATRRHQDLAKHERRILGLINETRETVRALQNKTHQLENVEEQQSRATPAIESLLANVQEEWDDPEDQALAECIKKGEQVSKRLRRLLV